MKQFIYLFTAIILNGSCFAQDTPPSMSAAEVARDVVQKINRISSFSATVETGETEAASPAFKTSSDLVVSRLYGWKLIADDGPEPYTLITDFQSFYQYFPKEKKVMKTTADVPELKAMLTKPVTDMNPLNLLDPKSLVYKGNEKVNGETVYHIEGTTQSQLMPGGPEIKRSLIAWISVEDGLPRKTVESVGTSTGTTVYQNVKVNPPVSPADFTFTPPPGTAVIDTNEQMRKMQQEDRRPSAAEPSITPTP